MYYTYYIIFIVLCINTYYGLSGIGSILQVPSRTRAASRPWRACNAYADVSTEANPNSSHAAGAGGSGCACGSVGCGGSNVPLRMRPSGLGAFTWEGLAMQGLAMRAGDVRGGWVYNTPVLSCIVYYTY